MQHLNGIVRRIVDDHHTVFFIGVMLILMGFVSLGQNMLGISFEMSYSLLALGMFNIVLAFAFIVMGAANVEAALESPEKEPGLMEPVVAQRIAELEQRIARLEKGE